MATHGTPILTSWAQLWREMRQARRDKPKPSDPTVEVLRWICQQPVIPPTPIRLVRVAVTIEDHETGTFV